MEKNMKMKNSAKIIISALAVLLCISIVFIMTRKPKEQVDEDSGSQAQMIEVEGDLEIIIPEDQESEGF